MPELQLARDRRLAALMLLLDGGVGPGASGWYTAYRDLERAEDALDTARWRLACESWRACRGGPMSPGMQEVYWRVRRQIEAWRFSDEVGSTNGVCKALVLRRPVEVAR